MIHKNYIRPTALEKIRINAMLKFGCIASATRKARGLEVPTRGKNEVHHLVEGNKRLGHGYTIVLNAWYHRGVVPYPATSKEEARARYGAALSDGRKAFYASHGFDDRDLFVDTQGRLGMSVQMPLSKIVPRRLIANAEGQKAAEVSQPECARTQLGEGFKSEAERLT